MKNFLYITMILLSLFGCKPGVPSDIIQPEEMAKVLHDIHLADGYLGMTMQPDSLKIKAAEYYKGIYNKYDIDSAIYAKSMDYYYKQPKVLNDIYVKVTASLTEDRDEIVKADSIINAKEMARVRMKFVRDSTRTADSTFWANFLLRDTSLMKPKKLKGPKDTITLDTVVKKKIDVMMLKMDYKGLKDIK